MNDYLKELDAYMIQNIGKKGIITDIVGTLSDHIGYDGEVLTIVDVVDGFYVTDSNDSKCGASYHCDANEFLILNLQTEL